MPVADLSSRLRVADVALKRLQDNISALGAVQVRDSRMWAGTTLLNGNSALLDEVYAATFFGSTIFLGNVRIATRAIAKGETEAAIGTCASDEVSRLVLEEGGTFRGMTNTLGRSYAIVYVPLLDDDRRRIGMLAAYRELIAAS